ncbi:response regulator [Silicimonas algicola]|uniref:histidine kinase n=1 Tax=Silicimonas algicola TaxID=1826607 RepID=A0A316FY29_9RHOB|nr:ATP-binding protein [Silicimonas algicola]AZQ68414.1 response regulator [Silicimonas algicola]PWK53499.1 PAS domain-containing protein [Silicimonas algicola]
MTSEPDLSSLSPDVLADAFESLAEGVAVYDRDERLVFYNQRYKQLLGPVGDLVRPGLHWRDLIQGCVERGVVAPEHESGEDWETVSEQFRDTHAQKTEIRQQNGRYFEVSYHPTRSGGFLVTRSDVTDRYKAEQLADDRATLLASILDANPIPVCMARLDDGKVVYMSKAAREMMGEAEYAIDFYFDQSRREEYVALLKEHGKVEDFLSRARSIDGSPLSVSLSGVVTEFGGEICVVSSITDLTEVLEREALIRQVVEAFPAPVLMNRADTGEIIYRSPELVDMLGPSLNACDFYVDVKDRAGFLAALRRDDAVLDYRVRLKNAEGTPFFAAVSGRLTEWNGEEVLVTFLRDLTHLLEIETELDRRRDQTFQNEKMMALGGLMAGVAHELNNPLSVVVGHAMMLQDEGLEPDILRKTRKISEAAERCSKIVKTFLSMARQAPTRMEETDVGEVIETAVEVSSYGDALYAVTIVTRRDPAAQPIWADPDQLTQLIINLVLNSAQAIAETGRPGHIWVTSEATGDGGTRITVADDGPGVPEQIAARVFEPFFTTKGVGKGTGIGLAMSHRIVAAHGGEISVGAREGGGAKFVVTLPRNAASFRSGDSVEPTPWAGSTRRVLVIDDEPEVADLNAEILQRAGYEVDAVYEARKGLELLRERTYDAILSDLNMPDVDGRGVFEGIAAIRPELASRIGFLTGDTMGKRSQSFLSEVEQPYIEKPVLPKELRAFVSRLIRSAPT